MLEKLTALRDALAADGVLRHFFVHPDTIIAFADGVAEAVEEQFMDAAEDRREKEEALKRGEERRKRLGETIPG